MRVTTWTEYSLIIALHLARRGRTGSGATAARELALVERLPAGDVEQILLPPPPSGGAGGKRPGRPRRLLPRAGARRDLGSGRDGGLRAPDVRDQLRYPPGGRRAMRPLERLLDPPGLACPAAAGGRSPVPPLPRAPAPR